MKDRANKSRWDERDRLPKSVSMVAEGTPSGADAREARRVLPLRGDYQIGFQQVSEILPVAGATFVGRIPESVQSATRYAAGSMADRESRCGAEIK
jgi:hypothetical protein